MTDTPTQRFLAALYRHSGEKAKSSGKGWITRCPAHDDRRPSLSISEGNGGRALVRCHADCTADAICAALELRLADLMPADGVDVDTNRPRPKKTGIVSTSAPRNTAPSTFATARAAIVDLEKRHGERSAMWVYHNAGNEPVGVIVRWDRPDGTKDIRPVALSSDGWIIGGMPAPRPLYCLPALAVAERVFVVEGEKCVEAARSIGLVATTSPHGSKSAQKADWSPLGGRQVVILPDNNQAGRAYADAVVAILAKLDPAPVVKVVDLPDLPEGGDIVDWIHAHGDVAEPDELRRQLEVLAADTPAVKPADSIRPAPVMIPWRPFPVDSLPEPASGLIRAGSRAMGCDSSYVALPLLSGLASAVGATRRVELKPGWVEPAVVWTAIVGESGTLKSPALSLALEPLKRLQAWELAQLPELMEAYRRDVALFEADMPVWKKKGRNEGEPPPERPEEPAVRRYLASDITIEALADRLQNAPRGLLVCCDELAAWLGSFDQYRSGARGGDVSRWLSMHRAEDLLVDRKSGVKTIHVPRAAVSVTGGIQPDILHRALGIEHLANGLAARLLVAMPPRKVKTWTEASVHRGVKDDIKRLFGRLLALDFQTDEDDQPAPIDIPLSSDGKAEWVAFYNYHAQEQNNLVGELASAWSKLEGYCGRLALIVHLIRTVTGDPTVNPAEIDADSIRSGAMLVRWFGNEVRRVYNVFDETDEDRERRRLVELIRRKGGSVTPRDLMRSSRQYRTAADAESALEDLVKAGIGTWRKDDHGGGRGRPVRRFDLADAADVDTNSTKPEQDPICVNVNAVNDPDNEWGEA